VGKGRGNYEGERCGVEELEGGNRCYGRGGENHQGGGKEVQRRETKWEVAFFGRKCVQPINIFLSLSSLDSVRLEYRLMSRWHVG
jgi:hypothetical protein